MVNHQVLARQGRNFVSILCAVVGLSVFAGGAASSAHSYELDQWVQSQSTHSASVLLRNIGPSADVPNASPGSVVASPSHDPDYRYHWVRDGALVMNTVFGLYERSSSRTEKARLLNIVLEYVDFSRRLQMTPNPSGTPDGEGLGLGEPKFGADGSAYTSPWGRPQNDGPALRAVTLIRLAHLLLDAGRSDTVRDKLYDFVLPARTVIKADLEFVSHHWRDSSFDVWEEVRGAHFYTRLVQRRALVEGAALAERLGDSGAAQWYRTQAKQLEPTIDRHWDEGRKIIQVTLDRDAGLDYKSSGLDVAVLLGVLHGLPLSGAHGVKDAYFSVTDDRVLATSEKLAESFRKLYSINGRGRDFDNQPLAIGIGRYPEDRYSGVLNQNTGNPWFLSTFALAEFYYRCAAEWESKEKFTVTATNASWIHRLKIFRRLKIEPNEVIHSWDPRFYAVIRGLKQLGDDYMRRGRFHADPKGAMSEQFNRNSGYMQSAEELTWSHASLLTAAWARGD